jgi:hypothetical protein
LFQNGLGLPYIPLVSMIFDFSGCELPDEHPAEMEADTPASKKIRTFLIPDINRIS